VFVVAALLKIEYFFIGDGARVRDGVLSRDGSIAAIVLLEFGVAAFLFGRYVVPAAYIAILIATGGVFVAADAAETSPVDCRCLGRIRISPELHVALSALILVLAWRVIRHRCRAASS